VAEGRERARRLAGWKAVVKGAWADVEIVSVAMDGAPADLGATRRVTADVKLGRLGPADVEVQLLHGPVGPEGDLEHATVVAMHLDDGQWAGDLACEAAGRYGYTVRVVPHHEDLSTFADLGCVTWVAPAT
jgi:starch phosphorylase